MKKARYIFFVFDIEDEGRPVRIESVEPDLPHEPWDYIPADRLGSNEYFHLEGAEEAMELAHRILRLCSDTCNPTLTKLVEN